VKLVRTNEDNPILSTTEMFARDCSFWRYVVHADIRSGSRARMRQ